MAITIPQISIDEVYISVLKAKLVTNEEGWSKMMPVNHDVRPSGSMIMDALVRLLNEKRYYYPAEVAEYFQLFDHCDLTQEQFGNYLFSRGVPDPDLIIRPGGEMRLSNFLMWESAYSELYFTDVLWPDFTPADIDAAVAEFHRRDRRFGGIKK